MRTPQPDEVISPDDPDFAELAAVQFALYGCSHVGPVTEAQSAFTRAWAKENPDVQWCGPDPPV